MRIAPGIFCRGVPGGSEVRFPLGDFQSGPESQEKCETKQGVLRNTEECFLIVSKQGGTKALSYDQGLFGKGSGKRQGR